MSAVLGWSILGFLAVLVSVVPPYFLAKVSPYGSYWDSFKAFNLFVWGLLVGCSAVSLLLLWALDLIGFIH